MISTREACGKAILNMGYKNKDIVVLDADLSVSTQTNRFANVFPERFFNIGCAEQNLVGTAAGLAIAGKTVFVGTYAMFITRAWEQIRNTVAHDNLNVKILASHSGFTNASDGSSHQCFEDIALMRCLPNMSVLCPVDEIEAMLMMENEATKHGPDYIRLNRIGVPILNDENYKFKFGKAVELRDGNDIVIIATGTMVSEALNASDLLKKDGIAAGVLNIHTIKPIDKRCIIQAAKKTGYVVSVEEHSIYGGLGGAVAEVLAENYHVPMKIMGINDRFGESGEYEHLKRKFRLNVEEIVKNVKTLIGEFK